MFKQRMMRLDLNLVWMTMAFIVTSLHHVVAQVPLQQWPKPCCLPYRFQAVITPLATFNVHNKVVLRMSRDWVRRVQVQDHVTFNTSGVSEPHQRTLMDFKNKVGYSITPTKCQKFNINYGMLEPCMPDKAEHIGSSYLGMFDDSVRFQTWHFTRTTKNRNINMTISVTSDRCVPVMEHITGRLGGGTTDTLVIFSNITREVDPEVFEVPKLCQAEAERTPGGRSVRSWTVDEVDNDDDDDDDVWNRDIHG